MYDDFLENIELSEEQILVYKTLLKYGPQPARRIVHRSGIGRSMVYKTLSQLEEMGLITRNDPDGAISVFEPEHPGKIRQMVEEKISRAENLKGSLEENIGQMISDYNLMSGKPNVRFFEGKKGMEEVLDDSLYAKEEILSYADIEAIEKFVPDINEEYVRKREELGIKKRGLIFDTPFNRKYLEDYHEKITSSRFIKLQDAEKLGRTVMQIYDDKISYLTLSENNMIGVILEDPNIYEMHKDLFEYTWQNAEKTQDPSFESSKMA